MSDVLTESYSAALQAMAGAAPRPLLKRVLVEAGDRGGGNVGFDALVDHLRAASPNDPLRKQLHHALASYDCITTTDSWARGTPPRTSERRVATYDALNLDDDTRAVLDDLFPVSPGGAIVISDTFEPWYRPEQVQRLYWPHYRDYLMRIKQWDPGSVADLDEATSRVLERLSDPERVEAYQSKGLVLGYVQSGKTANFTGVIAKAIDVGYRLVIILTGTVDILREQTQRRMDMELVGMENILRNRDLNDPETINSIDYQDDPDWLNARFISHEFLPSSQGLPDIIRLTSHRFDYKSLQAGITALEFEKADRTLPLYAAENLPHASARLVIVKKNKLVIQKLVKDLKSISNRLKEIPALIIDDESDQASVNTSNPKTWKESQPERTAINSLISKLLRLLPRAQYIGYTATPFANVFIDPSDTEDIFPKDFLVSLDRPPGYMGARDFHDLDSPIDPENRTVENSNEKAYVRALVGETAEERAEELRNALDSFVLSGALKLYREAAARPKTWFRHHTMLVHESVRQAEHRELANEVRRIWREAAYSSPAALGRLRELYVNDFLPVCRARTEEPFPEEFDALKPFVGAVVSKVTMHGDPVLIVNGDKDIEQQKLDFDKADIWRILVGGTKLSRGFTIEGLTVSYYRRKVRQADALMQMGRWFGFRTGYQDLVRLHIARAEPDGKTTLDLYEYFEAIVQDEELFREQLRQYSVMVDGYPQVTPRDIPPLVSQHLPDLRPAARNKMFNAKLVVRRSPGVAIEPTAYPNAEQDIEHNYEVLLPIMAVATQGVTLQSPDARTDFDALIGRVTHAELVTALGRLKWLPIDYFSPDLAFLCELDKQLDSWLVILPQTGRKGLQVNLPELGKRSSFGRRRSRGTKFHNITDPKHRPAAQRAVGIVSHEDKALEPYYRAGQGAVLVYPILEPHNQNETNPTPGQVVVAFSAQTPKAAVGGNARLVQFVARNKQKEHLAIVDVEGDEN